MSIKCFNCGNIYQGNFCPNCGAPNQPYINNSFYQEKRKMSPVGIVAMILLGILAFVVIIGISSSFLNSIIDSSIDSSIQTEENSFQSITGTDDDQESKIVAILKECGIKITSIEHDEMLDDVNVDGETGYRISTEDANNVILYLGPDKKVNIVRYADNNLYADGEFLSTINEYIVTWNEASDLQISCQKAIKEVLKSPSTAKFPNITKWKFGKKDGEIIIQGYVDAQNTFGAEIRSEFQFILSADDYTVKSLIFDGEEYISQ